MLHHTMYGGHSLKCFTNSKTFNFRNTPIRPAMIPISQTILSLVVGSELTQAAQLIRIEVGIQASLTSYGVHVPKYTPAPCHPDRLGNQVGKKDAP